LTSTLVRDTLSKFGVVAGTSGRKLAVSVFWLGCRG